jgi:hypothetical protein
MTSRGRKRTATVNESVFNALTALIRLSILLSIIFSILGLQQPGPIGGRRSTCLMLAEPSSLGSRVTTIQTDRLSHNASNANSRAARQVGTAISPTVSYLRRNGGFLRPNRDVSSKN